MANLPSIKTLSQIFGENAKEARLMLEAKISDIQTPAAVQRRRECFHPPKKYDVRLHALNALGDFTGVEFLTFVHRRDGEELEIAYLNAGDTYAPTLAYIDGNYRVTTFGDVVDKMNRHGFSEASH